MVLDRKFSALKANSSKEQSAKGHRKMTGKPTKRSAGRILSTDRSDVGNGIEYIAEEGYRDDLSHLNTQMLTLNSSLAR